MMVNSIKENTIPNAKLIKHGYRYHKLLLVDLHFLVFEKHFKAQSKTPRVDNVGLKTLHQYGISKPVFYGGLVFKFKRINGKPSFLIN